MRREKILSRKGTEFTAQLVTDLDRLDLLKVIAARIRNSPLKAEGLQDYCEVPQTDELLRSIKLYSTGNTTKEQVEALLQSVPGVMLRDLQVQKVLWAAFDPEFEIDRPPDPDIPYEVQFAQPESSRSAQELDYGLDDASDEDSRLASFSVIEAEDIDLSPASPPSKEQALRRRRDRHSEQEWKSYHSEGRSRFRKPIDPKTLK